MFKRFLGLFLVAALLIGVVAGCNNKPAGNTKDTVTMAVFQDFDTMDPHNSGLTVDKAVYENIFDTIVDFNDGVFTNVLCSDYTLSDDGLSYTINLNKGIKFHSGEELKSSDIAFSMNRAKESTSYSEHTKGIVSVDCPDDYTAVINLDQPNVPFAISVLSAVSIMSEKAFEEDGFDPTATPIGTGPYTFVERVPADKIVLKAFPDWHGGDSKKLIENAVFKVIVETSSALISLETGEIDLTYTMPAVAVPEVQQNEDLIVSINSTTGSGYLVFNLNEHPFDDPNFRLAIAYATNAQEIIDVAMEGVASPSTGVWDSRTAGFSGETKPVTYDLDKAKEYLAMTDYAGETLSFTVGYDAYKAIGVVVQEQLAAIGINVEVVSLEANTWITDMKAGNFQFSTIVQNPGLDVSLWTTVFHSSAIGAFNFSQLNNPTVDGAFDNGTSILDTAERAQNYGQIEKIMYEEAIVVPVYYRALAVAYNKDLSVSTWYATGYSEVQYMSWN